MTQSLFLLWLFTMPVDPTHFASSIITPQGYKDGGRSYATYVFPHNFPPSHRFLPYS
jgi:hypothetical protein